jgi:hypothetical protein
MATTVVKKYTASPYYDDFDETKNYHRVLFRPGYAVQARELTQLQTALQAQIDRYGQYAFKDGSRVVNGKVTLNVEYDFVKIESSFTHSTAGALNADNYLSEFVGTTITGATTGVTAKVLQVAAVSGGDAATLYVTYTNSGSNNTTSTFAAGEELTSNGSPVRYGMVGGGNNIDGSNTASSISTPTGYGSAINIEEGVYFISGTFAYVPAGSLILDKYTNTPNYIIGLKVTESIVDSGTDTTLLDNAQGVPNTAAPGANRYKISTQLIKEPLALASRTENDYITLVVIEDGKAAVDKTDKTGGTELTERLARRTFEESGDYVVEPFQINPREYLNTGSNFGFKTTAEIIADGDAGNTSAATTYGDNRLSIGIDPSVAYVKGFRVQNNTTKNLIIEKPRGANATNNVNVATTSIPVGNYVKLTASTVKGMPDVNEFATLNLHNATAQGGSVIGTARARSLEYIGTELRLYLFDISMTGSNSFSSVQSVNQTGTTQNFVGDLASVGNLFDVGNNGLVFKLPYNAVKTLYTAATPSDVDTIYVVKQLFETSGNSISIAIGQGTFTNTSSITASLGTGLVDVSPTISAGGDGSTTLTFSDVGGVTPGSTTLKVMADVQKNLLHKTKQPHDNVTVTGALSSGSLSLGKADIIRIVSVTDAQSTDITERFTLDNGQRDNYYDIGKVNLKPGFPTPSGNITVTFDYYSHGSGDYFTVDSYPTADYNTIPTFSSQQGLVQLRDCIDFRPRKADGANNFTDTGGSNPQPPKPGHATLAEVTHYMPRIDKIYITRKGEFKTEVGVPSLTPKAPETPEDAMGIYNLKLNPYVYSLSDVKPEIIDNRRYTMKDIGSLDKRIKNLEYYTSLSLLEQSAADVELFDGNNSRLKNGFIVDGFRGHNVADTSNPDYAAAIDKNAGILRPKFDERNVNLVRLSSDSGTAVKNGSIVTMPHTETNYINQPYSSFASNVNPYNVFSWAGLCELSPEGDEWKETDVRPTVIIDDSSAYDQFAQMAEETGILGTVWNEWETNWTGIEVDVDTQRTGNRVNFRGLPFEDGFFGIGTGRLGDSQTTITATTTTQNQSRAGLRTDLAFDTVQRTDGTRVVEVNFVPFIRSRKIYFKAQLLKPSTKVYAFFDGVNVTNYCAEESFAEFSDRSQVSSYENVTVHPSNSDLITDASGIVTGSFIIPRNAALKFQTGVREFRLTDSSTNNKDSETTYAEAQYHAQGLIESVESRVVSTKVPRLVQSELNQDRTLVDTQVNETTEWVDPLAETILIDKAGGIFAKSVDLFFKTIDAAVPVRVTIRTTQNGTPTQRIVPGADKILYPSEIATQAGTSIADFANANASVATNFAFDYPVYLSQDTEYAIVITSQSDGYEVYVAEMGGFDLTNSSERITKQPYNGVFFSSQNASTWTPEQSKDLKFKLNRASFTGSSAEITLVNDVLPVRKLVGNPLATTSGSKVITVTHKNHGMHDSASQVTIAGAATTNGITGSDIDGTYTISNITHDSYTITATGSNNATATGAGGGSSVTASENRHIDVMHPVLQNLQVPGTSLRFFATIYSSQSIDGSEAAHQPSAEFEILPNKNFTFIAPKMVGSAIQESQNMSSNKSLSIRCVLSTTDEALSPVIDMNRASVHTIQNIVSSNSGSEAVTSGGAELTRYITKKVELNEEADTATVFMNVNRPGSSNVDLYYRFLEGGSSADISDVAFIAATPAESIPVNENSYSEVRYDIDETVLSNASFGTIQFKIVLRSTVSSTPPKVKDFRAICAT